MKKTIIISSLVLTAAITAGIILNQPVKQEPIVTQALSFDGYVEPITAPEPLQSPELPETPIVSNQTAEVMSEPVNKPVEQKIYTHDEMWSIVFSKVQNSQLNNDQLKMLSPGIASAVMGKYQTNPELFEENRIDDTVFRCVSYFNSIVDYDNTISSNSVKIAIAKQDCGY